LLLNGLVAIGFLEPEQFPSMKVLRHPTRLISGTYTIAYREIGHQAAHAGRPVWLSLFARIMKPVLVCRLNDLRDNRIWDHINVWRHTRINLEVNKAVAVPFSQLIFVLFLHVPAPIMPNTTAGLHLN